MTADGGPVEAYACQILEDGIGLSLGNTLGYAPLEVDPEDDNEDGTPLGVIVQYTGGHFGCARSVSVCNDIVSRSCALA